MTGRRQLDPERWLRIEHVYHSARSRDASERAQFLAEACAGDSELRREVESLLAQGEGTGSFMGGPALEVAAQTLAREQAPMPGPDTLLGKTVSHYRILEKLGGGGMGVVYKAEDTRLGRAVALKFISEAGFILHQGPQREPALDPAVLGRFQREARAASALNHPNICTVYDVGKQDGQPFIAMELLEGETLRQMLAKGEGAVREPPLPLDSLLDLSIQIVEALDAAHQRGIIHRDIKPANIFIVNRGRSLQPKILDFGLAKLTAAGAADEGPSRESKSSLTHTGMAMGTVDYMSPEQARGEELDARTDLFSFGAVLYQMATGCEAFTGSSTAVIFEAILNRTPVPPTSLNPQVPPKLEEIINKALEKARDLRYQHASEIRADLKRLKRDTESGVGAAVVAAPGQPRGLPLRGRWRPLAEVSGVIVLGVLGWLAWHYYRPQSKAEPQVAVLTPDESTVTQVTTSPGLDAFPALSPDGSSLAYSSDQNGGFEIYVKSLAMGGREFQLTSDGGDNLAAAWSPDGKTIAYCSAKRGGVWLIPALGGTATRLTEFGSRPAWSPDSAQIAFQSNPTGLEQTGWAVAPSVIWLVPTQGGTPTQITHSGNPPGGHNGPAWSPDGKRISFTANASGFWSVAVDGRDLQSLRGKRFQGSFYDPAFSPDGQAVYFSGGGMNAWGLFRVALSPAGHPLGEPERIKSTGTALARGLHISADGKTLAYAALSRASNVWSIRYSLGRNEALGPPSPLTRDTNLRKFHPLFSPDGKRITYGVLQAGSGSDLWVVDADGKNALPLTLTRQTFATPGWFPGGHRLSFYLRDAGKVYLASLDFESGRTQRLREIPDEWNLLRLSPDGKQIAFNLQRGTINVWTAPVEGGPAKQLTFDKEMMGWPCWSPDGKFLAVETRRGDDTQVYLVPSSGGTPIQLTSAQGQTFTGDWSPDGEKIVFAGWRNGVWNLYWVSRQDKTEKQITNYTKTNSYVRYPSWSPRGDQIAYEYTETLGNIYVEHMK